MKAKNNYLTSRQASERLGISSGQFRNLQIPPAKSYVNGYGRKCGLWTEEQRDSVEGLLRNSRRKVKMAT